MCSIRRQDALKNFFFGEPIPVAEVDWLKVTNAMHHITTKLELWVALMFLHFSEEDGVGESKSRSKEEPEVNPHHHDSTFSVTPHPLRSLNLNFSRLSNILIY
jgi:hypothetical protein